MKAEETINALKGLVQVNGLAAVDLDVPLLEHLSDPTDVEARIASWTGTGWIARQSGVRTIVSGAGDDTALGQPVSAEIVDASGVSRQLRRVVDGWNITTVKETAGTSHLAETVRHVALDHRIVVYRRYWSLPDDGAAEVVAWRFVGFEEFKS
ncbi:hypothetical protein JMM61_18830 [Rhodovulum sulfidophilum]|uniref:hypothetical protein n=1 Tax=Rhodovulum sulfidophilum TaxID=35806 RepID=UPI001926C92B|nr:hypothetical protein [Rhodovulum sulfidophilum]MBL3587407.1 hypothetical protein [Rhodovulum sulfidophilum]